MKIVKQPKEAPAGTPIVINVEKADADELMAAHNARLARESEVGAMYIEIRNRQRALDAAEAEYPTLRARFFEINARLRTRYNVPEGMGYDAAKRAFVRPDAPKE